MMRVIGHRSGRSPGPRQVGGHLAWLNLLLLGVAPCFSWGASPIGLTYEGSRQLPDIRIDGRPTVIHTQGLFVTDERFYVTGRLEGSHRKALFVAFDRKDPTRYEVLDITPAAALARATGNSKQTRSGELVPRVPATAAEPRGTPVRLDHPGGFDGNGKVFWIPVAASRPRGPTVVLRLEALADVPLAQWSCKTAFQVEDHIGAVAWQPATGHLYGANWDTRRVYCWTPAGKCVAVIPQSKLLPDRPGWQVAVQDWKGTGGGLCLPPGLIVAGGIDQSPRAKTTRSTAVVDWLDLTRRTRLARVRLPPVREFKGTVTQEGLACHAGCIYLLPSDLGRGARVFRYRCHVAQPIGVGRGT